MVSKWFPLQRGCRQGNPLSPYLFLVCAEILAVMIRKNKNIKGVNIDEKEYLLMQYADDTALTLDGSHKSLQCTMDTLKLFAKISGLHINIDKSQVVWIGSQRGSTTRYLPEMNLQWNPDTFVFHGVKFTVELRNMPDLNYSKKLEEIKRLINQ